MAAKLIFRMTNDNSQRNKNELGECTAASLAWAKKYLDKKGGINSYDEIGINPIALGAQMAVIRNLDNAADDQTERAGLIAVNDTVINSLEAMVFTVKNTAPHVAIFWNSFHTMGYRYSHNEKEFFDLNVGLYRAKTSKEIIEKMNEIFTLNGYGSVERMRVVRI